MTLTKRDQILGAIVTLFAIALFLLYAAFTIGFSDMAMIILSGLFLLAIGFCIFIIRKYWKENKPEAINYLNVGIQRHLLGLFMIFYGVPKLFGGFFDYQLFALDSKLGTVSEFELAWYFYGKNPWQELVSGIMEFIPGLLLLNRRTYYFGAIILLPVTAQVFILNSFFEIGYVTFEAASVLLACNLYILYSEKAKILVFIKSLDFSKTATFSKPVTLLFKVGKWAIVLLAVAFVGIRIKNIVVNSNAQYQSLVGMYTLESMKRNGTDYTPVSSDSVYYKDLYIEKQSRWNILRRFDNKTDAFILDLNKNTDSLTLYINKGGIGDGPDKKIEAGKLTGTFSWNSEKNILTINGTQFSDTLQLNYKKQNLKPKGWLW